MRVFTFNPLDLHCNHTETRFATRKKSLKTVRLRLTLSSSAWLLAVRHSATLPPELAPWSASGATRVGHGVIAVLDVEQLGGRVPSTKGATIRCRPPRRTAYLTACPTDHPAYPKTHRHPAPAESR